jgi:membrane associated rhomboid family serine protease
VALHLPAEDARSLRKAKSSFRLALKLAVWLVLLLWVIFLLDYVLDLRLGRFGLLPGSPSGLIGIITAPLLHDGIGHLFNNSIPLLVAVTASLYLYPHAALRAIPLIWLGSGLLGWFIGRPNIHIGASGLLYGLLTFVFVSGVLRQDLRSVSVSLLISFLYGTLIWGIFPIRPNMSWELHLCGAILGLLLAWIYRKGDRVPVKRYAWEYDDSVPEWYPESAGEDFDLPAQQDKTPQEEPANRGH